MDKQKKGPAKKPTVRTIVLIPREVYEVRKEWVDPRLLR